MRNRPSSLPRWMLLVALLSCGGPVARAAQRALPVVAVFDVENKGTRLSAAVLDRLTTLLVARLAATRAYQVIPREQVKQRLSGEKKAVDQQCYSQSCQVEIGKELAANKSLATQVMRIGSRCFLTSTLYDLRTATTERAATVHSACVEEDVAMSVDGLITQLVGPSAPAPARRESAPDAPAPARRESAPDAPAPARRESAPDAPAPARQEEVRLTGPMDREQIRAVITAHSRELEACRAQPGQAITPLEGRVVVDFVIGASGTVASTRVQASDIASQPLQQCVLATVRGWRFPAPKGGGIVTVRYPFVFRPAAAARTGQAPSSPSPPEIQQAMRSISGAVKSCYNRYQQPGAYVVLISAVGSGQVTQAEVKPPFNGTPMARCIEAAVKSVTFPRFVGKPVQVQYPFVLR